MTDGKRRFIEALEKSLLPRLPFSAETGIVPAAVLIPVVFRGNVPHLIFTVRTMTVAHHKGQISFPGGAREPEDDGPVETALRETAEEIGLSPDLVRPLGCLEPVSTVSAFRVTPVVGLAADDATFQKNPEEVAEIFELPLGSFTVAKNHTLRPFVHDGVVRTVHHFTIGERDVWGVTGEIVHRLVLRLRDSRVSLPDIFDQGK